MTILSVASSYNSIDLKASAARVEAARRLAAAQADAVAACSGGASTLSIDLFFLLQESVLVFDETHAILTTLAAEEALRNVTAEAAVMQCKAAGGRGSRPLVVAAQVVSFLAFLIAASILLEIADPAPMEVQAVGAGVGATGR